MNDQIHSRQSIIDDADAAAQRAAKFFFAQRNPHEPGTQAHAIWKSEYELRLLKYSAPEKGE